MDGHQSSTATWTKEMSSDIWLFHWTFSYGKINLFYFWIVPACIIYKINFASVLKPWEKSCRCHTINWFSSVLVSEVFRYLLFSCNLSKITVIYKALRAMHELYISLRNLEKPSNEHSSGQKQVSTKK